MAQNKGTQQKASKAQENREVKNAAARKKSMMVWGGVLLVIALIFGVMIAVVPLTLLQLRESQRKDSIDRNLPLFLLALSSAVQSGANLIRAIEQTADRNMGALTPELRNLRANISWGLSMEDAFENFAERTGRRSRLTK